MNIGITWQVSILQAYLTNRHGLSSNSDRCVIKFYGVRQKSRPTVKMICV